VRNLAALVAAAKTGEAVKHFLVQRHYGSLSDQRHVVKAQSLAPVLTRFFAGWRWSGCPEQAAGRLFDHAIDTTAAALDGLAVDDQRVAHAVEAGALGVGAFGEPALRMNHQSAVAVVDPTGTGRTIHHPAAFRSHW
jgi:hypothetical protein